MGVELILVLGKVGALVAGLLVVHLEHVGGQPFGAGRLVVAQHTDERFRVGVQVALETPVVGTWRGKWKCGERSVKTVVNLMSHAVGLDQTCKC